MKSAASLPGGPSSPRRRGAAVTLLLIVTALHAWLAITVAETRLGDGAADRPPARIEAAFVRTLAPQAPVAVPPVARATAAAAPSAVLPEAAASAAPAASAAASAAATESAEAPESTASEPASTVTATVEPAPAVPDPVAQAPAVLPPEVVASAPLPVASPPTADASAVRPAPASALAPAFSWPPSTRLSYVLTGNFRGPVDGSAQVQWLREGGRYQVHLDVLVGPRFAPLVTRQMSSDGVLGDAGLVPRRYDEHTRVLFREARALGMVFEDTEVQLANGRRVARPAGVQDTVSQFVQLTWRFTLDPTLLREGRVLEVPLALPRRVETWVYDVRAAETLQTPAGPVQAVRVQPRREARAGGDLVAEMWFAPSLQYLPVRIVIRQDAETYVDLLVDRLPEQAAVPATPTGAASSPAAGR